MPRKRRRTARRSTGDVSSFDDEDVAVAVGVLAALDRGVRRDHAGGYAALELGCLRSLPGALQENSRMLATLKKELQLLTEKNLIRRVSHI